MDVSLGNENYFQDKFAPSDIFKSSVVIDNEGKSKRLDIESFLTTASDMNESSAKGSELNLPVTIAPCLDTLIENVVGELHKFDSINSLTISSDFVEDPSVASSKSVFEHSLSNYALFDLGKSGTNENCVHEMEKKCPKPEFEKGTSFEVLINRNADLSSVAELETDHIPSNDILREKEEEKHEVQLNYKEIESEKLFDSNEMQFSYEVNNIEQQKESLEFQNNNQTRNFVNMPFEKSDKRDDIENAQAICDGQFNSSEDYEMQLSAKEQSDQPKVSAIMSSKDSVNSREMDKNLFQSYSNEVNSIEQEKKSLQFQNNNQTENFVNMPFEKSDKRDDIENAQAICDGQFNGSEDYEMQLSAEEQSDQPKVSAIMSSKDSVNSMEMDKNLFQSDSNEVNSIEQEKKSLEFQNNNQTGNFVNMPFEKSDKRDDIENAQAICDGQFNGSEDCEMQLSAEEQSDQPKVSAIMSSKDSVNSREMDKNLFQSYSNEVNNIEQEKKSLQFQNNNQTGNFVNMPIEKSDKRDNIENAQVICDGQFNGSEDCEMQLSAEEQSDQPKVSAIMSSKDSVNSREMDKNLFQSYSNEVNSIEQEKKSLQFQNNNQTGNFVNMPIEKSDKRDDIENAQVICDGQFNGSEDCEMQLSAEEQSDQSKVSAIMSSKDSVNSMEMDKNLFESNSNEILFLNCNNTVVNFEFGEEQVKESDKKESKAKENSNKRYCNMKINGEKSENQYECEVLKGIENNVRLIKKDADVIKHSNDSKCPSSDNELHSLSDMKSCQVVLDRLKLNILKRYLDFPNLKPIQTLQSDGDKDRNLNTGSEKKSRRKLNRNLITRNVQGINKGKVLNNEGNAHKVYIEKHNSKSKKSGKHFSVEKYTNICSNLIKCSTSTKPKKAVYGKLLRNSLLNEDDSNEYFENDQKNKTISSDKNTIQELDEKLLNQQKSCEKRNSSERELTVEGDLPYHSKFSGLFKSELLNSKDGNSSVSKTTNSYEFDKTQNSTFMIKPCKVVLERLNSETLKMYSRYSFSNISECDTAFSSYKGTMLLDICLSCSPEKQGDEETILKKIQNKSPLGSLKKTSLKKPNSKLRSDEVNLKSLKMISSKINMRKDMTELDKNISSHVLESDLIKKPEDIQKIEFKGTTSERGSLDLQNSKHAKSSGKSNEATVVKRKRMHKSNPSVKVNIKSNYLNENPEAKSQKVNYTKKAIDDLKESYSIKECRIVLEKLDSCILESYSYNSKLNINQVSKVCQSYQYNIDSDINVCIGSEIVHIDRDGNRIVKSQKHLLKKPDANKTREKYVVSEELKKECILKTNFSFDAKSRRKTGSTFLKINSSKPDSAIYHSGEREAAEGPVLYSGNSQDNPYSNSVPQVNAIENDRMELDEANRLIEEQIQVKKCNVVLKQCDSAILDKYLGKDWSKNLPKGVRKKSLNVDIIDFEDSTSSNSTYSVFQDSECGSVSESNYQIDSSSDSDSSYSIEQTLEFPDKKDPKDLFCKSCKIKFKTYSSLLSHEKKTHKTFCFKCVLCKNGFKNRQSYINHMKRNHPEVEPYVCDYPKCEESFRNKKQLSDHHKSHHRYCCRFCKKRYVKKTHLQQHVSDCH